MAEKEAGGTEQLLPFERADSPADPLARLSAALDSEHDDSELLGEDEPVAPKKAPKPDEAEPEDDEPEDEAESEDESEDDDEAEGDEDEGPKEEPLYQVKVDGELQKVTLREALDGYQRQADYTRGKQEVARERETVQGELQQARAVRDQYAERLEAVALALKQAQPKEPDWDKLREENPTQYAVLRADQARFKEEQREIEMEQRRVYEERRADWEAQQQEMVRTQTGLLHDKIPEWRDPAVEKAEKQKLMDHLMATYGWTTADIETVTDHRLMMALRKSMLWDESQTNGQLKIRDKVKPVKVMKPGAPDRAPKRSGRKAIERARELARRSGRAEDVAAYLDLTSRD